MAKSKSVRPADIEQELEIKVDEDGLIIKSQEYIRVKHPTKIIDPPKLKRT